MDKLKSRKLWTAIVGVIAGVAMAFGLDAQDVGAVSGAVVSVVSVVAYIVTEGRIDAAAVGQAAQDVQDAVDAVQSVEETTTEEVQA